jgi:acyl carrier protein
MRTKQEIFNYIQDVLVDLFEIDRAKITLDAQLYQDLDIDSIDAIDLVLQLKEVTGKKIRPEEFKDVRSVADVVDAVHALMSDLATET